ncbi:hypothetical protein [Butyrivibrio proteoclasticus]|uniref:hypothetical protein n=1 Tax=Butyrivibrio proteoclasticus TaxID=43305 RepID=UPI00047E6820|nr:hypothetical protein [Butyrivibrio proteoclasticus]
MDIVGFVDTAVEFCKNKINTVMEIWEGMDEQKKRLLVGCVAAAVCTIVLVSIAYSIGKASGRKAAYLEEDF